MGFSSALNRILGNLFEGVWSGRKFTALVVSNEVCSQLSRNKIPYPFILYPEVSNRAEYSRLGTINYIAHRRQRCWTSKACLAESIVRILHGDVYCGIAFGVHNFSRVDLCQKIIWNFLHGWFLSVGRK